MNLDAGARVAKATILVDALAVAGFIAVYLFLLPLFPDADIGPYGAINLHDISRLVFVIMAVGFGGGLAARLVGVRGGLLLAGFLGGFASSTATIAAMGVLAKRDGSASRMASIAAILSTVATYVQLAFIMWWGSTAALRAVAVPLLAGGGAAAAFAVASYRHGRARISEHAYVPVEPLASLKQAALVAVLLTAMLVAISATQELLGARGMEAAAFLSGFVDGHAAAIALSEMVALKKLVAEAAVIPILLGLTSNAAVKATFAAVVSGGPYARRVVAGLAVSVALTWIPVLLRYL